MKLTKLANLLIFTAALALLAACKKTPVGVSPIHGSTTTAPDGVGGGNPIGGGSNPNDSTTTSTGIPQVDPTRFENYAANAEKFSAYTVHFDFDSHAVKDSEKSKVAAVADYMKANTSHAVRIEGHCDERGTEEYNRALGDRRANALREEMAKMGADPGHILTVSFGEDRPVDTGHDESAYKQNRRGVFILLTPP